MKNKLMQKAMKIFLALILLLNCVGMPARAEGEGKETITYAELITDLEDLQADDQIIIVNKAHKKALSQVYNGYYNSGEDVTVSDGRIYEYKDTAVWTLGVTDAGTYQFKTADGKKLSMAASRTSMPLDDANDTWNITAATGSNDVFFIDNIGRSGYRIEWYSTNNNWSAYNSNTTGDLFQQQIYRITEGEAPSNIPVASITLNDTTLSLDIGETAQLTAEVLPDTATDKSITWASDDQAVATVDGNGLVTAVAPGTASITVTANDGSGISAICGVRVNDPEAVFTDGLVTDLSQLKDGAKVVIYNDSAAKAISTSVLQNYYLSPVDVTIQDDKAVDPAAEAVWTLGIIENTDGTKSYTFSTSEGKKMSMNNDRNSLPLDAENV